jgi:hypothetical protein
VKSDSPIHDAQPNTVSPQSRVPASESPQVIGDPQQATSLTPSEMNDRLRQAARIMANGAIRAALKQRAALPDEASS